MNKYRLKSTGQVVTEAEYRNLYPNISFPLILIPRDADPILQAPQPSITEHQSAHQSEPVQDALGNWVTGYTVIDWTQEQIDVYIESKRISLIPFSVSPRQIAQALTASGLRQQVEDAVTAGNQDLKDWWNRSTTFERNNPQVTEMAQTLGVTERQLDDLWTLAGTL